MLKNNLKKLRIFTPRVSTLMILKTETINFVLAKSPENASVVSAIANRSVVQSLLVAKSLENSVSVITMFVTKIKMAKLAVAQITVNATVNKVKNEMKSIFSKFYIEEVITLIKRNLN